MFDSKERWGRKSFANEARHYVIIQENTSTTDGDGGFTDSWKDVSTVAAAIYPIFAKQVFQYRSINIQASHIIKMRGEITINEGNRIKFGIRIFQILFIENVQERGIEKLITCKELR